MNIGNLNLITKIFLYKIARKGIIKYSRPITLTFSVTNKCQSRCKTCNIWKIYKENLIIIGDTHEHENSNVFSCQNPNKENEELTLNEIEKVFKSMDSIYFFNISGGEPFLRKDLPEIVDLACKYLKPSVIHTPTNGISPDLIEDSTIKILEIMKENGYENIPFTIKPSLDGVGAKHDEIRGIRGNFEKVIDTYRRLVVLKKEYPNLHVGLGTVLSKFNYNDISEIADYVETLQPDSYINEIAEQRSELFIKNEPITPTAEEYERAIEYFSKNVKKIMKHSRPLNRITQSFRLVYYDLVVKILREKRQVIPCYAGISNVHINPYGEVWPCCFLGYDEPMGDLRSVNYDFKRIWYSKQANYVRKYIKDGNCHCPLANQAYSNILCSPMAMLKVIKNIIF